MTITINHPTSEQRSSSRAGAAGALVAAATWVFGIALFVTSLSDYTEGDPTPAESVEFLVGHQTTLFAWYLVIFLVFGVAIIPLARALHRRLADVSPQLADIGAVFAYIWAGLMFATGMISNIGITAVVDIDETDPAAAEALWLSIDTITEGLGGGNELVGGLWIMLVSLAAWGTGRLPTGLNVLGIVSAAAALVTLVPGLSDVGMIFGLGSIAWFAWTGVVLLRTDTLEREPTAGATERRALRFKALPWLWLGLSVAWAVVIIVTDQVAWPLALWIATTVGPLTALQARRGEVTR